MQEKHFSEKILEKVLLHLHRSLSVTPHLDTDRIPIWLFVGLVLQPDLSARDCPVQQNAVVFNRTKLVNREL